MSRDEERRPSRYRRNADGGGANYGSAVSEVRLKRYFGTLLIVSTGGIP